MKVSPAGIPLPTLVLFVCGSVLCLLLLAYLAYQLWKFWQGLDQLELKDRFAIKNDFIKTVAQILGGAFFLFGLYFTWSNLVVTQEKNLTDLYTKAVEQLGSDRLEVRLGGIYALERIARGSEKDQSTIMEVLTAYIRDNAPWPPEDYSLAKKKRPWTKPKEKEAILPKKGKTEDEYKEFSIKPDPDIQAVLTVIGRRSRINTQEESQRLDLSETDLRGADLREAHLEWAWLFGAHLEGANLYKTHLEKGDLRWAHLKGSFLNRAHLEEADLEEAHIEGAILWEARLERASLKGAYLERAWFGGAHFAWADLDKARLDEADFQNTDLGMALSLKAEQLRPARNWVLAYLPGHLPEELGLPQNHNYKLEQRDLSSYNLAGMDLRGANLSEIKGLTREQLAVAKVDEETVLPDYLNKPQPEKSRTKWSPAAPYGAPQKK
jgi:uncharacterized protein YjbI with pentapeptide repeats